MNKKLCYAAVTVLLSLPATADLVHRYSFNDSAGSLSATDSVGGLSWNATLNNTAALDGNQLVLDGSLDTFAEFPAGLITNSSAVTIETWASFGTQFSDWARLFDFGSTNDTGGVVSDFRLVPRAPGNYVDLFYGTGTGSAYANHPQGLDNQTNVHIVVVLDPATGFLGAYTNGILITGPPSGPLPALSTFTNQIGYLGKSFYTADPFLVGSVDEFRVWSQALTPAEIEADFEAGPNNVSTNPGALQSLQLSFSQPVLSIGLSEAANLTGTYANLTNGVNLTGAAGIAYLSGDTNILTVSTAGLVQAVAAGSTTVRATYQGISVTQSLTIAQNSLLPSHRYSFNDAPGSSTAADSVGGAAWNGNLLGSAVITNGQLVLDGTSGSYLELPAGIIGNGKAVTVEAWASFGTQLGDWSRLFSFGNLDGGVNEQFRLSPRAGGNFVDLNYLGAYANHPQGWDNRTNLHIVGVVNPPSGFIGIYANGVLIGQSSSATIPLSPAPDQLSYVGKSLYDADPYLVASIDEFRVYEGALSPDRIAIDTAAGPNNLVTNAGDLQSAQLVLASQIHLGEAVQATFAGKFANVSNVDLFLYGSPTVSSTDTNILTISPSGLVTAVGTGTATVSAKFGNQQSSQAVTVIPAALTHRYSFDETNGATNVTDSVGGSNWNGTLVGSATLDGTNVVLDGQANGYVQLPSSIISGYSAVTIETWVSFGANAQWARLWDFGDQNAGGGGNSSLYFSPHNGTDGLQMTMFKPGTGTDVVLSTNLDNVGEMQVVGVYTGNYMDLYFNGALVATKRPVNLGVTDIIDTNSFIGRSMFNADPFFTGAVDEFRIYQGALTPAQIASDFASGPNSLPTTAPSLSIHLGQGVVTISWPTGIPYLLATTTNLNGTWTPSNLSATVQNGQEVVTDTITNGVRFYRLQRGP